jgi:hypothetical protein
MHDLPLNQAVGLLGLAAPQAPQLVAVVAHGDARTEQPLLWQVSSALTELGYGVTVLDASVTETMDQPGLIQLLDCSFGHGPLEEDGPAWKVLPAALGLQSLCAMGVKPAHSLQRLGDAFQANEMIVLYAGVDTLIQLLSDSELRPLLSVSGEKSSLLTSYLALKRLLRKGRLEPTILNMMQDDTQGKSAAGVAHALRECARNFLAYDLKPIRIDPSQNDARMDVDMRRLATRLLENALSLQSGSPHGIASFQPSGGFSSELTRFSEVSRNH